MIRRVLVVVSAALIGGALALAAAAPAQASAQVTLDFGVLVPGQSGTASGSFLVDRDSVISAATWTGVTEPAGTVWTTQVCSPSGNCTAMEALPGTRMAAGSYTLRAAVTLPATAPQAYTLARTGRFTLVEDSGSLAVTGGTAPWLLAVVGAAAAGGGALLLLLRRRRREEQDA